MIQPQTEVVERFFGMGNVDETQNQTAIPTRLRYGA